jgi:hypothetical protein
MIIWIIICFAKASSRSRSSFKCHCQVCEAFSVRAVWYPVSYSSYSCCFRLSSKVGLRQVTSERKGTMATMAARGSCHVLPTWPTTRSAVAQGRSQNPMHHNQVSKNGIILSPRNDISSSLSSQHGASSRLPSCNALTKPQHVTLHKLTAFHRSLRRNSATEGARISVGCPLSASSLLMIEGLAFHLFEK